MSKFLRRTHLKANIFRSFSTTEANLGKHSCKILVVGGGTGGCSTAAKFTRIFNKNEVVIIEPSENHFYQPLFTLIGGGVYKVPDARKTTKNVLPSKALWLKDRATEFDPKKNSVKTANGDTVTYDVLLVAMGLQTNYDKIPGLLEGLNLPNSGVCSNYSEKYVERTYESLKNFESGNAIFTFPNSPVKCPGAPQKICYIADAFLRKVGKRDKANLIYNTSLPVIFGVKKYADALWKLCKEREINVNLRTNLVEVKPKEKIAIFENLDEPGEKSNTPYSLLHVTPPMSTPDPLRKCSSLANEGGFVEVDKSTMQSLRFPNVFAIGDCSSSPNSKTAAAAAAQSPVVFNNIKAFLKGKTISATYDGYASCPLVTGYNKCILAEFDYNLSPLETFPFSQDRELYSMYILKKVFMPHLYWNFMLNGYWNGPAAMRKLLHLGFSK